VEAESATATCGTPGSAARARAERVERGPVVERGDSATLLDVGEDRSSTTAASIAALPKWTIRWPTASAATKSSTGVAVSPSTSASLRLSSRH
jgi:hypothetical protein